MMGRELNASVKLEDRAHHENLYQLYGFGAEAYEKIKVNVKGFQTRHVDLANKYLSKTNFWLMCCCRIDYPFPYD